MTLISSISGIRGTIGGRPGENLTPDDILMFAKAYAQFVINASKTNNPSVIIGRDARVSGLMVQDIITGTLRAMGINCICLGLTTTPTTELAVVHYKTQGGIIITASHNPANWNALKLLNSKGEFLSAEEGRSLEQLMADKSIQYVEFKDLGTVTYAENFVEDHIRQIINLPLVDVEAVKAANLTVVADVINSAGAVSVKPLLRALGVNEIYMINDEADGIFAHNPEPLPEHLKELSETVVQYKAHLGISVDPDVDRLALVMENGEMFGEEYTLVAVADYVLSKTPGNTVSNLSSTRALAEITKKYSRSYSASAVGEVNVIQKMKETNAVIGGEGNGGVIYPPLHYGRDALAGIALFLTHLAKSGLSMTALRKTYPAYFIAKHKINTEQLSDDFQSLITKIKAVFPQCSFDDTDGFKITFPEGNWVHLRTSNTEPIIRIYAEDINERSATKLAKEVIQAISQ